MSHRHHDARPAGMAAWHAHLPPRKFAEAFRALRREETLAGVACRASDLRCEDAASADHHGKCHCPG